MAQITKISPLAPAAFPDLPPVAGVRFGTAQAGVRYAGRTDVLVALIDPGASVAGIYTTSKCPSEPVQWCRQAQQRGAVRAIIVNSGNANAFTGKRGLRAVEAVAMALAEKLGCPPQAVMMASTGVIGEPLPFEKITAVLDDAIAAATQDGWEAAARAIMTTDTFPKGATATAILGGKPVTVAGIAKGSGMIAPDMATMLGFLFTDAAIPAPALQALLAKAAGTSFNCVTVDSDTSTSDTLLLAATGAAGNDPNADLADFARALQEVCDSLAIQLAQDGEGAEKLVTIRVNGAVTDASARRIALSIANSPLVKTAIAGEDANWGRIVAAVGKAGEPAERDRLKIAFGGVIVARDGYRVESYDEAPVNDHLKGRDVRIDVDLGLGQGTARVWTCDLTHAYIDINGSYRS